jgi:2-desacetyl-2-hydroxyethyl bacteriochlorophyllide A dehydrogenase
MQARALQFVAPRRLALVEVDLPKLTAGCVHVRTLYSGISTGTELLAYRGDILPDVALDETIGALGGAFSYPFRYGYSAVGIVERSASQFESGKLLFAFQPHQDQFICPAETALPLPEVAPRIATLFPLIETALQIKLDAGEVSGIVVVVMGLGAVGLLVSMLLRDAGASVLGVDPSKRRRDLAVGLGVEASDPSEVRERLSALAGEEGVPLVIEVSGNPRALGSALPLLAHEGTVLVASWYGKKTVSLQLGAEFHRRRLSIRSSQVSTIPSSLQAQWSIDRRRRETARLLKELPLTGIATHEFPFERAADAFAALDGGDDSFVHVALSYELGR